MKRLDKHLKRECQGKSKKYFKRTAHRKERRQVRAQLYKELYA